MTRRSRICFCGPKTITKPSVTSAASRAMLPGCWPGYVIGRPPISSRSFANAIRLPANETLPISAESTIETDTL
jgi:hypothetical protein